MITRKQAIDLHKNFDTHFLAALATGKSRDYDVEFEFNKFYDSDRPNIKLTLPIVNTPIGQCLDELDIPPSHALERCAPEYYKLAITRFADSSDTWLYYPDGDYFVSSDEVLDYLDSVDDETDHYDDLRRENMKGITNE